MKRIIASFVLVLVAFLAIPNIASAQYGGYGRRPLPGGWGGGGGSYGYGYDPYLERTMQEECYQARESFQGMQGTFHAHNGQLHFRPCDHTNNPMRTREGGAWGALGGAAVGGAVGGRRGAAIGAVGGAVTGGVIANRGQHDDCILVDPQTRQSLGMASGNTTVGSQVTTSGVIPGKGPAFRAGDRPLGNYTRGHVEIYDGDRKDENFVGEIAPGEVWQLAKPRNRYRAFAEVPSNQGDLRMDELRGHGTDTGWNFGQPVIDARAQQ